MKHDNRLTNNESVSIKEYIESEIRTVRELLKTTIDERDRLYDTRFKASEIAVNAALAAQEKAVTAAFTASEKAIVKAEDAQKDYNQRSNEFRGQLDDQAKTLMPRIETIGLLKSIEDKLIFIQQSFDSKIEAQRISNEKVFDATTKDIGSLRESRSEGAGKGIGIRDFWSIIVVVISILIALIGSRFIPGK